MQWLVQTQTPGIKTEDVSIRNGAIVPSNKNTGDLWILDSTGNSCAWGNIAWGSLWRFVLKISFSAISIITAGVVSQWKGSNSLGNGGGLISLLIESYGKITSRSDRIQGELAWVLNPRPDTLLAALALWGLSIIALRKLCCKDRYNGHSTILGAFIGIIVNLYSSIVNGTWSSFGCYIMMGVSICMALSMIGHVAFVRLGVQQFEEGHRQILAKELVLV